MDKFKPIGTLIHGVGASEAIDSSGERISIKGLDISSLETDGYFNYEHKNDQPFQIVGKILKAKKIFGEEDCTSPQELYFWNKVKIPYLYIMGELFDGVGHKGAQDIAAMLQYDMKARKMGRPGKNTVNFSVEGSKLHKEGNEITKALARKITITALPCNKQAVAELLVFNDSKDEGLVDVQKSEGAMEILRKDAKIFKLPTANQASQESPFGPKIGQTKSGKDIFYGAKPLDYKGWTAEDHGDAINAHMDAAKGKDFKTASRHNLMARWHKQAMDRMINRLPKNSPTVAPPKPAISPASTQPKSSGKLYNPEMSGKVEYKKIGKALTAGSGMTQPEAKTGGEALSKEDLMSNIEKISSYPKFLKFVQDKYQDLTKSESEALAKYLTARQAIRAEEALEKIEGLDKSKNVREQKKKIFGTDPNAPRVSPKRAKMMGRIKEFAEKRFGMPMVVAEGKRTASGEMREDKNNQPPYDVFSPEGVEREKKLLQRYKKKGIKRTDPKPDWRSGRLETQPSPDAAVHELAHLYLAPEGMTPAMFQEEMDRLWGESQEKYGHLQQKKTSGEIQPMAVENPIRRELGLPANRTTKPVKQQEQALDYEGPRFVEGKDSQGRRVFYDRQSRLMTPETKERVEQVREGSLKFDPKIGWYKDTSPDTLINLRGRGRLEEAKERARRRYAQEIQPKKMAASELEKARVDVKLDEAARGAGMGPYERKSILRQARQARKLRQETGARKEPEQFASASPEWKEQPLETQQRWKEQAKQSHSRFMQELKGLKPSLPKSEDAMKKRCWEGYRPVPGKKPYSKGSCEKK